MWDWWQNSAFSNAESVVKCNNVLTLGCHGHLDLHWLHFFIQPPNRRLYGCHGWMTVPPSLLPSTSSPHRQFNRGLLHNMVHPRHLVHPIGQKPVLKCPDANPIGQAKFRHARHAWIARNEMLPCCSTPANSTLTGAMLFSWFGALSSSQHRHGEQVRSCQNVLATFSAWGPLSLWYYGSQGMLDVPLYPQGIMGELCCWLMWHVVG